MQPNLKLWEEEETQTEEEHILRRVSIDKPYEYKITHPRICTANSSRFGLHIQLKLYFEKRNQDRGRTQCTQVSLARPYESKISLRNYTPNSNRFGGLNLIMIFLGAKGDRDLRGAMDIDE